MAGLGVTCLAIQFAAFPREGRAEDGAVGRAVYLDENGRRGVSDGDPGCAGRAVVGESGRRSKKERMPHRKNAAEIHCQQDEDL